MLKLMKYEIIHSVRTFMTAFGIFLVACVLFPFLVNMDRIDAMPFFTLFMYFGISFLIVGIGIALFVSIFMNYNQSMFKRPGYLTLTLPVSTTELIISKVLVTMIWLLIAYFVLIAGVLLMSFISYLIHNSFTISMLINGMKSIFQHIYNSVFNNPWSFFEDVFSVVSLLIFLVSSIYFSLTLTHTKLVKNHRMLIGTIVFFVLLFIIQYILSFFFQDIEFIAIRTQMQFIQMLIYMLIGIALTIGTVYIIDHHIEID